MAGKQEFIEEILKSSSSGTEEDVVHIILSNEEGKEASVQPQPHHVSQDDSEPLQDNGETVTEYRRCSNILKTPFW